MAIIKAMFFNTENAIMNRTEFVCAVRYSEGRLCVTFFLGECCRKERFSVCVDSSASRFFSTSHDPPRQTDLPPPNYRLNDGLGFLAAIVMVGGQLFSTWLCGVQPFEAQCHVQLALDRTKYNY
jgi:hypothetical protein